MEKKCILGFMILSLLFLAPIKTVDAASKDTVIMAGGGEPSTFDPHRITGFPMNLHYPLVFDNLVFRDRTGKIIPKLAKSWRLKTPTQIEFKLRKGIKFSNGEPVDAEAVKFSLERILDPKLKSRQYGYFRGMARVEIVDKYTVIVHTKYPDNFLLGPMTSYGNIVPPKYYKKHNLKYLARNPVGSGPYKLVRWKKGEEFVYKANPNYWGGAPKFKNAIVKIIPEANTRVAALMAGDVDIIYSVPPQLTTMVQSNPKIEVVAGQSARTCFVIMIIKKGSPWEDVRVRRALNHGINKKKIVDSLLKGHARVVATNVGPTSFGYNPNLKPFAYDTAKAKKLLADAGYPKGFSVDMYIPHGRYLMGRQTGEAIGGQLSKIGVKVNVRTVPWPNIVKRNKSRWEPHTKPFWWYGCRMDMHLHSEGMYAGQILSKATYTGFKDKEIDKLATDARAEPDDEKRKRKYQAINAKLRNDKVPLIFLWQNNQIHAKRKDLEWKMRPNAVMLVSEMSPKKKK